MKLLTLCFLLALLSGCTGWPKGNARRHAIVDVRITNKTTEKIDEAKVYFGEYRSSMGVLGPGGSATHMWWDHPITTNAIVRWRDARQIAKEETVNLTGIYEPKFKGGLTFTIGPTNVTATFEKEVKR